MAFTNTPEFEDDFRKVGPDATAGFEPAGTPSNPTEYAGSENVEVAGATEPETDDLEEEEDLDDEDETGEDDDLEEDDEDEDEDADDDVEADDVEEDDEDLDDETDDEDDDEDEDDLEEDDDTVKARLGEAEKRVRAA